VTARMDPENLNLAEAARRLGVHVNTVATMLTDGRLKEGERRGRTRVRTVLASSVTELRAALDAAAEIDGR
jgi:DNA-directed RNA polymerase specialized sigma24 family protein